MADGNHLKTEPMNVGDKRNMGTLLQNPNMIKYLFFLLIVGIALPATATTLTATPDRTVITADETLQLTVRIDEQIGFGGPDFSLLEEHFEILNQHRSNQFRSINGRTEGWTEWNLVLAPKQTGKLLIPSFNFEGAQSNAVEITVNTANAAPPGEIQEIFSEMELSKDKLYVQEQLLVTFRIFSAVQVREISLAESFAVENANVELVSETNFRRTIKGQVYRAYEVIYAVHPQHSEALLIPGLTWNLILAGSQQTNSWFNDPFRSLRGQVKRLRTDPRTVTVNPVPTNYSGVDWLPAADISLEQHWSADPSRFVVGEPISRSITLTAKGLTAAQIPTIPQIQNDVVKTYSDQPQFDEIKSREGVTGIRIETSAIVPKQAGEFTLPPVRVTWWDTVNGHEQVTELAAQTINVAPASISNIPAIAGEPGLVPEQQESSAGANDNALPVQWQQWSQYWPLLLSNVVFALLSVGFFMAWLSARQQKVSWVNAITNGERAGTSPTLNELTRQLRVACGENDAAQVKQALGHWGQAFFQLNHIASLQDIAKLSKNAELSTQLQLLEKDLYSAQATSAWQGQALWQQIAALIKQHRLDANSGTGRSHLKPLYPNAA